jgi:hypothetical protein
LSRRDIINSVKKRLIMGITSSKPVSENNARPTPPKVDEKAIAKLGADFAKGKLMQAYKADGDRKLVTNMAALGFMATPKPISENTALPTPSKVTTLPTPPKVEENASFAEFYGSLTAWVMQQVRE